MFGSGGESKPQIETRGKEGESVEKVKAASKAVGSASKPAPVSSSARTERPKKRGFGDVAAVVPAHESRALQDLTESPIEEEAVSWFDSEEPAALVQAAEGYDRKVSYYFQQLAEMEKEFPSDKAIEMKTLRETFSDELIAWSRAAKTYLVQFEQAHQNEKTSWHAQIKSLGVELSIKQDAIRRLNRQIRSEKTRYASELTKNQGLQLKQNRVEGDLCKAQANLLEVEAKVEPLQEEVQKLKKENKRLSQQCSQLRDSANKVSTEKKALQKALKGAEDEHQRARDQLLSFKNKVKELRAAGEKEKTELTQHYEAQLKSLETTLRSKQEDYTNVLKEREAKHHNTLEEQSRTHKLELQKLNEELAKVKAECTHLQKEHASWAGVQRAHQALLARHNRCQQELQTLRAKTQKVSRENGGLRGRINTLEAECQRLRSSQVQTSSTFAYLSQQLTKAQKESTTLKSTLAEVTQERDNLQQKVTDLSMSAVFAYPSETKAEAPPSQGSLPLYSQSTPKAEDPDALVASMLRSLGWD